MPSLPVLLAFVLASTLLVIIPGPNVMYIVTRGISQGRRAAVTSALGVQFGSVFYVATTAVGLSALLAKSGMLFNIVKYAGAAYLVWLGLRHIMSHSSGLELDHLAAAPVYRRIFFQGTLVNLLNPKVALFFLALFPQFVDPSRGNTALQIVILGSVMILVGLISDCSYAVASGSIGLWLKSRQRVARQRQRFSGVVYILLGALAAFSGHAST